MRNEWGVALVVCAALAASGAHAGSTADDLAQIEAEHVLLKARLRVLETRAQIAARRADIDRLTPAGQRSTAPTVGSIEGLSGQLHATLVLDNGQQAEVRQGDVLPNGMRVVSIQSDGVVVLTSARKRMRLKPADEAVARTPGPAGVTEHAAPLGERTPVMPPMPQVAATSQPAATPPAPNRPGAMR